MFKNRLILLTLLMTLSSCGFHFPEKNNEIHVSPIGNTSQEIVREISKRINLTQSSPIKIEFGTLACIKSIVAYNSDGKAMGYNLSCSIPIKIRNSANIVIYENDYSARTYLRKIDSTKTENVEIEKNFSKLRSNINRRIIKKLSNLANNK